MGKRGGASAPATVCARALLANVINPQRVAMEPANVIRIAIGLFMSDFLRISF